MSSKRPKRLVDAKRRKDSNMLILETHLFDAMSPLSEIDSKSVLSSFDQLVESCISRKQWTQLLDLFQRVDDGSQDDLEPPGPLRTSIFAQLLKKTGDTFFRLKSSMNALEFYRKSVKLSQGSNLLALESFDNLLNELIDRWHFPMMNDKPRNEAYSKAFANYLGKYLTPEAAEGAASCSSLRVLDIGCGTGLLSALFVENFARVADSAKLELFACEQNELFVLLAKEFLESVQRTSASCASIRVIDKHSDSLDLAVDFERLAKLHLIIAEIFDDGLLGEHCLETFYNAIVVNQLTSPCHGLPITIPKYAKLYVVGIECDFLRKSSRFSKTYSGSRRKNHTITVQSTDDACLFDSTADNDPLSDFYEPYSTENLNANDFRVLTTKLELDQFRIHFCDRQFLKKYCEQNETTTIAKRLKCLTDGRLDAYVLWFKLYLDDEVSITNAPACFNETTAEPSSHQSTSWNQAVYTLKRQVHIRKDQDLEIELKLRKDCVLIRDTNARTDSTASQCSSFEFRSPPEALLMLNNSPFQELCSRWLKGSVESSAVIEQSRPIRLLYHGETFNLALFDILLDDRYIQVHADIIVSDDCLVYLNACAQSNDEFKKQMERVRFVKADEVQSMNEAYDIVFTSPVDANLGILRSNFLNDMFLLSSPISSNAFVFPKRLELRGMFVECEELMKACHVESSSNFCLSEHQGELLSEMLKKYQVRHQLQVNLPGLNKRLTKLTETKTVLSLNLASLCDPKSQSASQLRTSFLGEKKQISFPIISKGRLTAFVYWYVLQANDEPSLAYDFSQHVAASVNFYDQYDELTVGTTISADFLFGSSVFNVTDLRII